MQPVKVCLSISLTMVAMMGVNPSKTSHYFYSYNDHHNFKYMYINFVQRVAPDFAVVTSQMIKHVMNVASCALSGEC